MGDQLVSCSQNFLLNRRKKEICKFISNAFQTSEVRLQWATNKHTYIKKTKARKTFAASPGQTADEELEAQPGETVRLLLSYENRIPFVTSSKGHHLSTL